MTTVLVAQQPSSTSPVDRWLRSASAEIEVVVFTEVGARRTPEHYDPATKLVRTEHDYFSARATSDLFDLCRSLRPDRIVSNAELDVVRVATARTLFGIPGFGATVGNQLRDKLSMKELFGTAGIPAVPYLDARSASDVQQALDRFGTIVVKPRFGVGSQGVRIIDDTTQLTDALCAEPAFLESLAEHRLIAEAFALGQVLHIDAAINGADVLFCAVSEYVDPPHLFATRDTCSIVQEPGSPLGRWGLAATRSLASSLPADHGVSLLHFEAYHHDGHFLAGEVAGRLGGGAIKNLLRTAFGVDLSREGYLLASGLGVHSALTRAPLPPLVQPAGMVLWTATEPPFGPEEAPEWVTGMWVTEREHDAHNSVDSKGGAIVLGSDQREVEARVAQLTGRG